MPPDGHEIVDDSEQMVFECCEQMTVPVFTLNLDVFDG
jgi:hypothetical protein